MLKVIYSHHLKSPLLQESFSTLPADNYLKSDYIYRYRAYGICEYKNTILEWKSHSTFYQSVDLNNFTGGLDRKFGSLSKESEYQIEKVVKQLINKGNIPNHNYAIGCHQIRITVEEGEIGYPAPEGFHQDGFDYLAICCVSLSNVNGAISLVQPIRDKDNIYEHNLLPGEIMILNDRWVRHFATPMTTKIPHLIAKRDILVVTFSQLKD